MKKNITLLLLTLFLLTDIKAQLCDDGLCYKENGCFPASQINKQDYVYSTVQNTYGSATSAVDLVMTVYSPCILPVDINDIPGTAGCNQCKRPLIMLIHGGGFRAGCRTLIDKECLEFAKRGYVVANIDYRLGWVPEDIKRYCSDFCFVGKCGVVITQPCRKSYSDSLDFAAYRALQDAHAAMRFIVHYAVNLNIDTSYLYVGGYSAGSITALNLCYVNQSELNTIMPKAQVKLGPVNSYGNAFTDTYKISGLFNNWGGIDDTTYINGATDKIPMIAFHGTDDSTVPFAKGFPLSCRNGAYGTSTGSSLIYARLANRYPNLPLELYSCLGSHGIFDKNPQTDSKTLYRIQKAICFFNRIRKGDTSRKYIIINKQEEDISYAELKSISPVDCEYPGLKEAPVTAAK